MTTTVPPLPLDGAAGAPTVAAVLVEDAARAPGALAAAGTLRAAVLRLVGTVVTTGAGTGAASTGAAALAGLFAARVAAGAFAALVTLVTLVAAAAWLDRCLNNTSLVFVVEVEDVRIVFPGDAQWGVWREILANTDARALLERATLYKVSHHGSHNGSPKSLVHDVLPGHITSMMSFRSMERWTAIPQTDLVAALRTPGRTLLRPDEAIPATGSVGVGEIRRAADGLWTEIDLG